MAGNLAFHREEHRAALDKFATARRIYSDLSQVGTPSQRELFATFSEELQPFIRFCEHRLALQGRRQGVEVSSALDLSSSGDSASNALLQSKIDVVLLEARKQKVANLGSVEWKGKQIAIPSQELGMALLGPDEVAAKLEALPVVSAGESYKKRDVLFLSLLSAYDSVLQLIKTEIGRLQQQSKSGSALVHTDIEVLQVLEEYVRFQKLAKQVERSVSVYQKLREFTQTTGELTHILDMLVQSVGDILSIPSLSELEPLRAAKYSAYQATFRAVRAATIAQSYQQQRRFAEAMSLYQYAAGFLGEADEILSVHPASKDDVLQEFGKSLGEELGGAVSRTTAQSFLQQSTASEPDVRSQLEELELSDAKSKSKSKAKATVPKTRKSLLERQDEFAAGSAKAQFEVVKLPPAFQAVPSKPMLFDVAFNELEMPDITERTKTEEEKQAEAAEAAKQASSGGLFGWFRK
jgi:signal recognition particle subunit SRP68